MTACRPNKCCVIDIDNPHGGGRSSTTALCLQRQDRLPSYSPHRRREADDPRPSSSTLCLAPSRRATCRRPARTNSRLQRRHIHRPCRAMNSRCLIRSPRAPPSFPMLPSGRTLGSFRRFRRKRPPWSNLTASSRGERTQSVRIVGQDIDRHHTVILEGDVATKGPHGAA